MFGVLLVLHKQRKRAGDAPEEGNQENEKDSTGKDAKVQKTDAEWKKTLTPEQYRVTRQKDTEKPFTGQYWNTKTAGIYRCVCCGAAVRVGRQVRRRLRLAEFLSADRQERHPGIDRQKLQHGSRRSGLQALRRASRPRLQRRPPTDRPSLLHQFGVVEARSEGWKKRRKKEKRKRPKGEEVTPMCRKATMKTTWGDSSTAAPRGVNCSEENQR